ncbi:hypothetical protein B0O80DRAFT_243236 [Mortierella sp. GBAus27b]|nr:hypothetical protein B0O80DRAFT_243236 [Mortierella sp. GBAus27b]
MHARAVWLDGSLAWCMSSFVYPFFVFTIRCVVFFSVLFVFCSPAMAALSLRDRWKEERKEGEGNQCYSSDTDSLGVNGHLFTCISTLNGPS